MSNILLLQSEGKLELAESIFANRLEVDQVYQEKIATKLLKLKLATEEKGLLIGTEGWFSKEHFVKPFYHTFKYHRLLEGDRGPISDVCLGNILVLTKGNKLTKLILDPLQPLLTKIDYEGFIGVECVISEREVYFLNFTVGFTDGTTQLFAELLKISISDFIQKQKDLIEKVDYTNDIAIGVTLTLPPFPYKGKSKIENSIDVNEGAKKHVWPLSYNNIPNLITARGQTMKEAQRRVYRTIQNIVKSQDVQYRLDIGETVEEDIEDFKRWCNIDAGIGNISEAACEGKPKL